MGEEVVEGGIGNNLRQLLLGGGGAKADLAIFLVLKNQKGHLHSGEIELELEVQKLEHKKSFAEEQI